MEMDCVDGGENVVEPLIVKEDIEDSVIDEDGLDGGVSRSAKFSFKPFDFIFHTLDFYGYTYSICK